MEDNIRQDVEYVKYKLNAMKTIVNASLYAMLQIPLPWSLGIENCLYDAHFSIWAEAKGTRVARFSKQNPAQLLLETSAITFQGDKTDVFLAAFPWWKSHFSQNYSTPFLMCSVSLMHMLVLVQWSLWSFTDSLPVKNLYDKRNTSKIF